MKSSEFITNESLLGSLVKHGGQYLINKGLNKMRGVHSNEQRIFANNFIKQFQLQKQINSAITLADFLDLYWDKLDIDITRLPLNYKKSYDAYAQKAENDPDITNLTNLASAIFAIAQVAPARKYLQTTTTTAAPTGTNQRTGQQQMTNPQPGFPTGNTQNPPIIPESKIRKLKK